MDTDPQTLPHNIDAEKSIIGAAFIKPELPGFLDVAADQFYDPRHRHIWRAMQALIDDDIPIDTTTLEERLSKMKLLTAVGGLAYLSECALTTPTADNAEHYASIVREKAVSRGVMLVCSEVVEQGRQRQLEGDELLARAYESLGTVGASERGRGGDMAALTRDEYMAMNRDFERAAKGEIVVPGIPTGLRRIDRRIGGVPFGILSILAARPAMGKTTLAICIANAAYAAGSGVHYFSLEDRSSTFAQRQLSNRSGVSGERIRARDLDREAVGRITDAANAISREGGWYLEEAAGLSVGAIIRTARARRRELGTKLVIIDYVQLIDWPDGYHSENSAIEYIITKLNVFSAKDDMAVLILSQLNRELEKRDRKDKRPRLSDLRGSGALEQQGKLILGMYYPPAYERYEDLSDQLRAAMPEAEWRSSLEILLLKNHGGESGRRVRLHWDRPCYRIEDGTAEQLTFDARSAAAGDNDDEVPF